MSGIAGVWNLDGRPVDRKVLEEMTRAAAHRGPDGIDYRLEGPVGFAHLKLATTPEARRETQPLADETGTLCLTFDGRLDNREDLERDLRAERIEARDLTDAELVLRSYQVWGEDCPRRFLGDFALALWDARKRSLFCARDILGWKPFHYYLEEGLFVFASQPAQLLAHPDVPCEPDETTVAIHLAHRVDLQEDRSFFRGIRRLMPAHRMTVTPDSHRIDRYWTPEPARQSRHRSDADYAAHFRDVFREAVRCRLRTSERAGAYLSGGLDSSSVVGMTQSLLRDGATAPGFDVFSLVFPGRRRCDESGYIRAVKELWDLSGNEVDPEDEELHDFHRYEEWVRLHREIPFYPNGAMHAPLLARAREKGFRVILTGLGGDDWLSRMPFDPADCLREGCILELAKGLRSKRELEVLWRRGLRPLLASWLPFSVQRMLRRRRPVPLWLGRELARRVGFRELAASARPLREREPLGFARSDRLVYAMSGWPFHAAEMGERLASSFDIECRHPFCDRRVIEFALALPREQRFRDGIQKFVLRQAVGDLLPGVVRDRRTKAEFSHVMAVGIRAVASHLTSLEVEARGWVRRDEVRRMFEALSESDPGREWVHGPSLRILWKIFAVEMWLRLSFNRRSAFPEPEPGVFNGGKKA